MSEPLDLMNVLEVKSILTKCDRTEAETFRWIIKCANTRINNKGLDKDTPFRIEPLREPVLSDHSSDEDFEVIEDSDSE